MHGVGFVGVAFKLKGLKVWVLVDYSLVEAGVGVCIMKLQGSNT